MRGSVLLYEVAQLVGDFMVQHSSKDESLGVWNVVRAIEWDVN